jgi:hypothetical protein
MRERPWLVLLVCLLAIPLASRTGLACACGCSVFEVGTSSMFPFGPGGTVFLEYDFLNQDRNWSGMSRAPAEDNPDKGIRTHFLTLGLQYMVDPNWGFQVEVPYWHREFLTADGGGNAASYTHGALADIRVQGLYSGFSPNLASGISFGLKLPTGDTTYPNFDRDTEIGTGSTDLLLGAHHRGSFTETNVWSWFVQAQWDQPFLVKGGYRPGAEIGAGGGVHYNGWSPGGAMVTPVLQVLAGYRFADSGSAADPDNTGYTRVLGSPGLEVHFGRWMVYGDVRLPVYVRVNGNQLVAEQFFKLMVAYSF